MSYTTRNMPRMTWEISLISMFIEKTSSAPKLLKVLTYKKQECLRYGTSCHT